MMTRLLLLVQRTLTGHNTSIIDSGTVDVIVTTMLLDIFIKRFRVKVKMLRLPTTSNFNMTSSPESLQTNAKDPFLTMKKLVLPYQMST